MPRPVALIARKDFTYRTRALVAGEPFQTTPMEAALLCYQRKASFAPTGTVETAAVETPEQSPAALEAVPDVPAVVDDVHEHASFRVIDVLTAAVADSAEPSDTEPAAPGRRRRRRPYSSEPE